METSLSKALFWAVGAFLAFFAFVVIAFVTGRTASSDQTYDEKRAQNRLITLAKLRADEELLTTTADWVNKEKMIVRLPLTDPSTFQHALTLIQAKPVQMGQPLPVIAPAKPSPSPAPAAPAMAPASSNPASPTPTPTPTKP